ncbi:sulfatase-like hydrolase/transferase [Tropicimonas aquimaris]|uniref:Sulfatase-like hydrolase/transferase n=1 Tax=Tropicimonas aquimaris TaxID=914152 RepID=A0ABW3IPP2_9RHOB
MKLRSLLATSCLAVIPSMALAADHPNILLIIADDMGLDASNCYSLGDQQAPMPNVEAMCREGLVFMNAYSAPVCSPTRATMMTGQYGMRTGVGAAIPPNGSNGLAAEAESLFDVLEGSDYATNLLGKWHLAGAGATLDHPSELGVSDYWGVFKGGVRDYFEWAAVTGGEEVPVEEYATTAITDEALDWIAAQDSPWFLWLAYNAPHTPFHLPPEDLHSFRDLPADEESIKADELTYYQAMLEALDTEIGRLLETMDPETRDNTIVMFIGDNGSPNQVTRGFYGSHSAKGTIYEGGTHVPFVVTGPGIESGSTDDFVGTTDFFATITGFAGIEVDRPDSHDFRALLAGEEGTRDYIYVEHFQEDRLDAKPSDVFGWALREGDYKLVSVEDTEFELYDLAADPRELIDLLADGISEDEAAIVARLQTRAEGIRNE